MRVNIYAEEMTDRIEIVEKEIDGVIYTGLRFYLELPVTLNPGPAHGTEEPQNVSGPFMHRAGDDDSAAVTFWGKKDLQDTLQLALSRLQEFYAERDRS